MLNETWRGGWADAELYCSSHCPTCHLAGQLYYIDLTDLRAVENGDDGNWKLGNSMIFMSLEEHPNIL